MTRKQTGKLVLLVAAVLAIALGQTTHAGVIAHWTFDSDFSDSSPSNNDLSVGGSDPVITTTAAEWKHGGGAADFDNNDWLTLATTLNFTASDPWSVSFWGKRHASAAAADGMVIGEIGNNQSFIWTPDNPNVARGLRFRNVSGANADYTGFPDDHAYHHWVVVADGSGNIEVYRDNISLGSQTPTGGTAFNASGVGHAYGGTAQVYYGQLDELYVFDEAISSDVVASLYGANQVPEPSTLLLAAVALSITAMSRRRRR